MPVSPVDSHWLRNSLNPDSHTLKKTAMEMVGEANARVQNLNPDQVAREVEAGALIVDVREPNERAEASIPGSISAPRCSW